MIDKVQGRFWGAQIDNVMREIAREAFICEVKILQPGVIERVLHNDDSVCGTRNPAAFKKLRDLLMMGFVVREKAFEKMGALEADALIKDIREELVKRFGDQGGPPSSGA
jgi:hypothetical protein